MTVPKLPVADDGFKPRNISAVAVLLDGQTLVRGLGETQRLAAAYELADEAAEELRAACRPDLDINSARRLLIRALVVTLYSETDATAFLRDLLAEMNTPPDQTDDPTDWATVSIK